MSQGRKWTWANNRKEEGYIAEKLDRFFGVVEWNLKFPKVVVQHDEKNPLTMH